MAAKSQSSTLTCKSRLRRSAALSRLIKLAGTFPAGSSRSSTSPFTSQPTIRIDRRARSIAAARAAK
jgi:hypothetical protein